MRIENVNKKEKVWEIRVPHHNGEDLMRGYYKNVQAVIDDLPDICESLGIVEGEELEINEN